MTAAYALDALEPNEERELEAHLRVCERCREELAAFTEAATALAYGVEAPAPTPALRDRILADVRGERSNVVPFRRRGLPLVVSSVAAAAATVAAVGLGLWANSLSNSLARERAAGEILADPAARSIPVRGAEGRLVVARDGEAALDFLHRRGAFADAPRPGLIYLDIEMPGMGGQDTLRAIRSMPDFRETPIVMMTGVSDEGQMRLAAENGANSYTLKPASAEQFLSTVLASTSYWLTIHQYPNRRLPQDVCRR